MALTRRLLKGMGLTEEQVDTIIDAHTETVDGLKEDLKQAKKDAEEAADLRKQLKTAQDDLKAAQDDGWKDKHDKVKKELDDLKADISNKAAKAAKEKAVRAYYESKNITGDNLELAMRGSRDEVAALELDGDKPKDTKALDELIAGPFAKLVSTTQTKGARTETPPSTGGSGNLTKEDIYKRDDKGRYVLSTAERQKAIAENHEQFGI